MERQYDCVLVTEGYRIRITVFTNDKSKIEELACQQASERLRQVYGIRKAPIEFVVIDIVERIFH